MRKPILLVAEPASQSLMAAGGEFLAYAGRGGGGGVEPRWGRRGREGPKSKGAAEALSAPRRESAPERSSGGRELWRSPAIEEGVPAAAPTFYACTGLEDEHEPRTSVPTFASPAHPTGRAQRRPR